MFCISTELPLVSNIIDVVTSSSIVSNPLAFIVILLTLQFPVKSTINNFKFVEIAKFEISGMFITTGPVDVSHSNLTSCNWVKCQDGSAIKLYTPVIIFS